MVASSTLACPFKITITKTITVCIYTTFINEDFLRKISRNLKTLYCHVKPHDSSSTLLAICQVNSSIRH